MSRYCNEKIRTLTAYTPGEQPKDGQYIKLNTNELPYPPPPSVVESAAREAAKAQLYSDPECTALVEKATETFGVKGTEVLFTNGSDEILNFAFAAFCDCTHGAVFPDISYGFYKVFAELYGIPYREIPLRADFSIAPSDYAHAHAMIVIANPNAPTGSCLSRAQIEEILQSNPDSVVVIDEAYVDFGAESCVPLVHRYDNLLVTQTFSKSRALAGARLGMGFACEALIDDLRKVKFSTNPYSVNRMTMAAGRAALCEEEYFSRCAKEIAATREATTERLRELGFTVLDSKTNFLFVRSPKIAGEELYAKLKRRGILVRHFNAPRIAEFNRVSIGTPTQMQAFTTAVKEILEEKEV